MRKTSGADARAVRIAKMQELVDADGPVALKRAAQLLEVTEMTLRRDLAGGESPLSCLGGYVLAASLTAGERYSLDEATDQHAANKRLACQRAARQVKDGDSLFIDCGTTMVHFAESLPSDLSLSVVCYSLNIANILSRRPQTQVMLLGGLFHSSSATFFSDEGLAYLERLGINKAFISAGGVHPQRGASCSNFHEVPVKQAAVRSAAESFLVVDESKLDRVRPAFFAKLEPFSKIVVGGATSAETLRVFRELPLDVAKA
jgi:DeoR family deoxyribose operon repressor